ncbi:MAG: radical SAM protein, partial [Spirochaetia bacterium]
MFDLLFDITELPRLPTMISHYGVVTPAAVRSARSEAALDDEATDFWRIGPRYSSTFEAYVPIQNGCDKYCTFCAVPYRRGPEVLRPSEDIIGEIRGLLDRGYVSFTLLGQNVNSYGKDQPGTERTFAEL